MKILYKKDSKNKIRLWTITTIDDELIQSSGLLDGKMVEHSKLCKPKNVGKSNATTGSEQAILEMESLIKSKLTEGYFETKEQAENELVILPMLASDYKLHSKKIDWNNCFIQPKLDGMRCLAIINNGTVILKSRDGKIIENMDHIKNELSQIRENVILDGELYLHGSSFQENMKLIKKYRKGETEKISYHIYDVVNELDFDHRNTMLEILIPESNILTLIQTEKIHDEESLKIFHSYFIEQEYEGSIIRHSNKGYELDKRSTSLLKYKDFHDIALPIHDVVPADAIPEHGQFIFYWKGAKGHSYGDDYIGCGMKFSHEDRKEMLLNKKDYIGKTAEVRYFEKSDSGVLRFPVCVGIRLDK